MLTGYRLRCHLMGKMSSPRFCFGLGMQIGLIAVNVPSQIAARHGSGVHMWNVRFKDLTKILYV